jgi:hypothetical protein
VKKKTKKKERKEVGQSGRGMLLVLTGIVRATCWRPIATDKKKHWQPGTGGNIWTLNRLKVLAGQNKTTAG